MVAVRNKVKKMKKQNQKNGKVIKVNSKNKMKKIKSIKLQQSAVDSIVDKKKIKIQRTKTIPLTAESTDKNSKKRKYMMPRKAITEELINSCLHAVLQLNEQNKKSKIFEDETPIFAEIHCIKIQNTNGNIKFVFPHSTVALTEEICLITPDLKKGKRHDHEPTITHWEELLAKAGVTKIKTILPLRQLKVEYDQFELKRRLLTQHDFIMVDTRVLNHASHLLGQMFFKKHNMLIPVRINEKKDIKKSIDNGLCTGILRLNEGETSTILVGHTGMPLNKLKENVMSLIQQLPERYPGGEANIRSVFLKLPLSLSVPLYLTLRPSKSVLPPKLKRKKPKNFIDVEDEISTIPGGKVRVAPDGTVILKRERINDSDDNQVDSEDNNGGSASEKED